MPPVGGGAAAADAHALNALALEASGRLPSSAHGAALTSTDLAAMQARNGGDVGLGRLGAAEAHLSLPLPLLRRARLTSTLRLPQPWPRASCRRRTQPLLLRPRERLRQPVARLLLARAPS